MSNTYKILVCSDTVPFEAVTQHITDLLLEEGSANYRCICEGHEIFAPFEPAASRYPEANLDE